MQSYQGDQKYIAILKYFHRYPNFLYYLDKYHMCLDHRFQN